MAPKKIQLVTNNKGSYCFDQMNYFKYYLFSY
jgi:arylamine N-acetyltransferase